VIFYCVKGAKFISFVPFFVEKMKKIEKLGILRLKFSKRYAILINGKREISLF